MPEQVLRAGLRVAQGYARLIEAELLPGSGLAIDHFWEAVAALRTAPLTAASVELLPTPALVSPATSARVVLRALDLRWLPAPALWLDTLAPLAAGEWAKAEDLRLKQRHLVVGAGQGLAEPKQFLGHLIDGSKIRYLLQSPKGRFEIVTDFLSPAPTVSGVDGLSVEAVPFVLLAGQGNFAGRLLDYRTLLSLRLRELAAPKERLRLLPELGYLARSGKEQVFQIRQAQPILALSRAFEDVVEGVPSALLELATMAVLARRASEPLWVMQPDGLGVPQVQSLFALEAGQLKPVLLPKLWASPEEALLAFHAGGACANALLKTDAQ